MKKAFGILFIIIGVVMIGMGIVALTDVQTRSNTVEGWAGDTFSESYRQDNQDQQIAGLVLTIAGLIVLIIGIVMTASKSKPKSNEITYSGEDFNKLNKKSIELYNKKDYLAAIAVLRRMIDLNPRDQTTYFNLSCCHSLSESLEGINTLAKAVELGYTNFDRIKTYEALAWLRSQKEFEDFVKNGYKLTATIASKTDAEKVSSGSLDEKLVQLEKLGKLKEQGILSETEFQEQKKKILG